MRSALLFKGSINVKKNFGVKKCGHAAYLLHLLNFYKAPRLFSMITSMNSWEAIIPLFIAAIILMLKPGPHMMTMISLSASGSWRSVTVFFWAYIAGSLIQYTFFLKTLSLLPPSFGMVFIFLKALAAMLFVSMGMKGFSEKLSDYKTTSKETQKQLADKNLLGKAGMGVFLSISNPIDIVFIITVIPALTGLSTFTFLDILIIRGLIAFADGLVASTYCIPILMAHNFMNDQILRKLKLLSSALMILIGLFIFYTLLTGADLKASNLLSH